MRPILLLFLLFGLVGAARAQTPVHGLSLLGAPELPADFPHFPYVNPDAPKGGELVLGAVGSFDSFHPFIVRGSPAASVGRIYDTLMRSNDDEPEAYYGHLAGAITVWPEHKGVTFTLRPQARFNDGSKVTADDVAWTFNALRDQGKPRYRQYYADVAEAIVEAPGKVGFRFKTTTNRELPLILGQLVVLPKAWWQGRDFSKPLAEAPLGSGPYRVADFELGRSVTLARVPNYWAQNLPTGKGLANFDRIRTEYFRDDTIALQALKAGQVDFRQETSSKAWATAYDFPAVEKGLVKKEALPHRLPTGMQGFFMNTRRPIFADARVRQALAWVFDFEWVNANLFYGAYARTGSYFSNSELAASGLPSAAERALLDPFRTQLPPGLFTDAFKLPVTDASGNNRAGLRLALGLLKSAGWEIKDLKLVNAAGQQMSFEILLSQPAMERVALPYVQWLARLGIEARVRTVDPAQYQRLSDSYDFDMTDGVVGQSDSPGNEQTGFWGCGSAKLEGGDNAAGVCHPAVEAMINHILIAPDRAALVTATRALDRVLLWNWYAVPHWHNRASWVVHWDRFGHPTKPVRVGLALDAWWFDAVRAAANDAARKAGK